MPRAGGWSQPGTAALSKGLQEQKIIPESKSFSFHLIKPHKAQTLSQQELGFSFVAADIKKHTNHCNNREKISGYLLRNVTLVGNVTAPLRPSHHQSTALHQNGDAGMLHISFRQGEGL